MPRRRPVDPAVAHVITGYDGAVRNIRQRVHTFVRGTWGGLEQYRDADINRFVQRVVPVVAGGQLQVAALTDAYLAAVEQDARGVPTRPRGVPRRVLTSEALRNGTPATTVYRRPAVTLYTALSKGAPLAVAVEAGLNRALSISATDLQLARTHATRYVLGPNTHVTGYRRVPNGGNVCELCDTASTQLYTISDLMPIHPGCSCGVEPDYGPDDPGRITDADPIAADDREDAGADVAVHDHGELGPVLAVAGQHFTGPDDLDQ